MFAWSWDMHLRFRSCPQHFPICRKWSRSSLDCVCLLSEVWFYWFWVLLRFGISKCSLYIISYSHIHVLNVDGGGISWNRLHHAFLSQHYGILYPLFPIVCIFMPSKTYGTLLSHIYPYPACWILSLCQAPRAINSKKNTNFSITEICISNLFVACYYPANISVGFWLLVAY